MDILKSTLNISRYWFLEPQTIQDLQIDCTPLRPGQQWSPIDDDPQYTKSIGLVEVQDYERPAASVEVLGAYLFFRVRIDVKKVPAAVLNRRIQQAVTQEREESGGRVSKTRQKEIKEAVRSRMEGMAEPVPHTVMVATDGREILVTTTTAWVLEDVETTLWILFGRRPFVPANLYTLANWQHLDGAADASGLYANRMASEFMTNLYRNEGAGDLESGQLEVYGNVQVEAPMGAERIQVAADGRSEWPEVSLALSSGQKVISKAGLLYSYEERDFELKLNSDWSAQGLRVPDQDARIAIREGEFGAGVLLKTSLVQEVLQAIDHYALNAVEEGWITRSLEETA